MNNKSVTLSCLFVSLLSAIIIFCSPVYASSSASCTFSTPITNTMQQDEEITITITLTNGSTRTGILVAQTKNSITIKTASGTEVIQKKYIVKTDPPIPGMQTKPKKSSRRGRRRRPARPASADKPRPAQTQNRFELFLSAGMAGGLQLLETIYEDGLTVDYFDLTETTTITPEEFPNTLGISAGFTFYFSRNLGLSLALHYVPKTTLDIYSSYDYLLEVPGYQPFAREADWTSSGELSLMPITINLVYSFFVGENAKINLYAGPAIIFANIDLAANMGYGVVFEDEFYLYPEWYDIPLYISTTETIVGGNAGIDLEYKLTNRMGLFAGFQYFFAKERQYLWEIDVASVPIGEINDIPMDELNNYMNALNDLEVFNVVKYSFYKAFFGIKIYL